MGRIEVLKRRKVQTYGRERIERRNGLTGRTVYISVMVGIFLLWIMVSIIIIDCIFKFFIVITKFEQNTEQRC